MSVDAISVKMGDLRISNPTVLASGVHGSSMDKVVQALRQGAGAAVTKSIGLVKRDGYPEPTMVDVSSGMVNAAGLPNPGAEGFAEALMKVDGQHLPIVVSIFGGEAGEFAKVVGTLDQHDFAAYELNLSCPHVAGAGTEIGHFPEEVAKVTRAVKSTTKKPIFAKLSPNTDRLVEVARAALDAGADGLTAINTVKAFPVDIETGRQALSNGRGGLSGESIRQIALRCVYDLREEFDAPIMGCGGVATWEDAVRLFLAGANVVQLGSSTVKGFGVFNEINLGIISYLERKGVSKLEGIIGLAHRGGFAAK